MNREGKFSPVEDIGEKLEAIRDYRLRSESGSIRKAVFCAQKRQEVERKWKEMSGEQGIEFLFCEDLNEFLSSPHNRSRRWYLARGILSLMLLAVAAFVIWSIYTTKQPQFEVINGETFQSPGSFETYYTEAMVFKVKIKETGFWGRVDTQVRLENGGVLKQNGSPYGVSQFSEPGVWAADVPYFHLEMPDGLRASSVYLTVIVTNRANLASKVFIVLRRRR
jgi:hypothetical protein